MRGLTILVNFRDVVSTVAQADVSALLNDPNYTRNGNFCSAREYFRLVSTGKLDYSNDVVGPLRLSRVSEGAESRHRRHASGARPPRGP